MEFFDKLGKKATEAYKITADKTGKIAKETKLKLKMSGLRNEINDLYEEIGKKVYEEHIREDGEAKEDIREDLENLCVKIDVLSDEIEDLLMQCLELRDKKICQKCFKEIDKNMKFCSECGAQQEDEQIKEVDVLENVEDSSKEENMQENTGSQTNLEKTTEVEINPDSQNITEEELKNIGQ